jgi:2-keto-3-deoxy-L-rhamnonate aldolase RhmA
MLQTTIIARLEQVLGIKNIVAILTIKRIDSILTGEKYFGQDSINITNIAEIQSR